MAASGIYHPSDCRNNPRGTCSRQQKRPVALADLGTLCEGGSQGLGMGNRVPEVANDNTECNRFRGCGSVATVIARPLLPCAGHGKKTAWGDPMDAGLSRPEVQK